MGHETCSMPQAPTKYRQWMSQMQEQLTQHSINLHILQPKPLINHLFTFISEAALVCYVPVLQQTTEMCSQNYSCVCEKEREIWWRHMEQWRYSFTPCRKEPLPSTEQNSNGRPHNNSGCLRENKNSSLEGMKLWILGHPAHSLVTVLAQLSWFLRGTCTYKNLL